MRRMPAAGYRLLSLLVAGATLASVPSGAGATPALVMDVASGDVLYNEDATKPWYPASLTKLMTVYVALSEVRAHRISLDTPLVVSARAASMPPSKMGFAPGTEVTLDNALKMLMVRSANDLAITVAEGVSGSVEAFAEDMNQAAATLGLRESHFVNPNGLPDPNHVSSARDMAVIARALYKDFPEEAPLFNLGALALGTEIITNHNNLLGRYPGADGMKTGFTCSAGFNVVASAYKDGRRLVTVIMGAPSVAARTAKAAALFDRGFAGIDRPSTSIVALPSSNATVPPDMRNEVCRNRARLIALFNSQVEQLDAPFGAPAPQASRPGTPPAFIFATASVARPQVTAAVINQMPAPVYDPVAVHLGPEPGYAGAVARARPPHSPIGTEPDPTAAIAYAAQPAQVGVAGSPLGIDASALPMKGRRALKAARSRVNPRTLKASAEAPTIKVMEDDKPEAPAAPTKKAEGAKPVRHATTKPAATKTASVKTASVKTDGETKPDMALPPRKPVAQVKPAKVKPAAVKPLAVKPLAVKDKAKASSTE